MSKRVEKSPLFFNDISDNISRKFLTSILRSFDKNSERLHPSGALPLGISGVLSELLLLSGAVFPSEFSETSPSASVTLVPPISVTFPVTVVNSSVETVVVSAASLAETCAVPQAARDNAVAVEQKIQSDFFISFLLSKVCCFSVVKRIVAPHPKACLKTGKNLQILISSAFPPIL